MPFENLNMEEITDARAKAIAESVRPIDVAQLKALGETLFPYFEHPWREKYFNFIEENSNASFYHATTHDQVHIIYCKGPDKGIWFLSGSGMGPLQAKGREILKEIVEKGA